MLLDSHPVAPCATSNLAVLNYSDPTTKPYLLETLATQVHGYDVMVAVKGKYGPVFVGKTWLGNMMTKVNLQRMTLTRQSVITF
jgi:hypothetical protein